MGLLEEGNVCVKPLKVTKDFKSFDGRSKPFNVP